MCPPTFKKKKLCDDASDTVLIENNGVTRKWVATPFWIDSIVFSKNNIARSSQSCRSVDADARCKRALIVPLLSCSPRRVMLQAYATHLEVGGDDALPARSRHVYPMCLEGFAAVTSAICSRFPHYLSDYVKAIGRLRAVFSWLCNIGRLLADSESTPEKTTIDVNQLKLNLTQASFTLPSTSPFFVPFKNELNTSSWSCLHITSKGSKVPLTKTGVDGTCKQAFRVAWAFQHSTYSGVEIGIGQCEKGH